MNNKCKFFDYKDYYSEKQINFCSDPNLPSQAAEFDKTICSIKKPKKFKFQM